VPWTGKRLLMKRLFEEMGKVHDVSYSAAVDALEDVIEWNLNWSRLSGHDQKPRNVKMYSL